MTDNHDPKIIDVTHTLKPSPYPPSEAMAGDHDTEAVLRVPFGTGPARRFGLGYIDPTGHARRVTGGPILPGPYAYAFGMGTCISADPRMGTGAETSALAARGLVFDARVGDVLCFQNSHWRIDRAPNGNVKLTHVKVTVTVDELPDPAPVSAES